MNSNLEDKNSALDPNLHVLIGHELSTFLNSGLITPGNISSLLKNNGVYVPTKNEKTIPILSSMILAPETFHKMLAYVVNKEQRPKYRIGAVKLSSCSTNWIDALQDNYESLKQINCDVINNNIKYEKTLTLEIDQNNTAIMYYKLRRNHYNQDLLKRNVLVEGTIRIEKKNGKLEITSIFSSKETEELNNILIKNMSQYFFSEGLTEQESIIQIKFNDFTNKERIVFFNKLVKGYKSLSSGNLEMMEVMVDPEMVDKLPDDPEIEFLKGNFKGLKTLGGEELSESFFIKKIKYYPYYFIPSMDVKYDFSDGTNHCCCTVGFFFKSVRKSYTDSVFDFFIKDLKYEKGGNIFHARRKVELKINQEIQKMIEDIQSSTQGK